MARRGSDSARFSLMARFTPPLQNLLRSLSRCSSVSSRVVYLLPCRIVVDRCVDVILCLFIWLLFFRSLSLSLFPRVLLSTTAANGRFNQTSSSSRHPLALTMPLREALLPVEIHFSTCDDHRGRRRRKPMARWAKFERRERAQTELQGQGKKEMKKRENK